MPILAAQDDALISGTLWEWKANCASENCDAWTLFAPAQSTRYTKQHGAASSGPLHTHRATLLARPHGRGIIGALLATHYNSTNRAWVCIANASRSEAPRAGEDPYADLPTALMAAAAAAGVPSPTCTWADATHTWHVVVTAMQYFPSLPHLLSANGTVAHFLVPALQVSTHGCDVTVFGAATLLAIVTLPDGALSIYVRPTPHGGEYGLMTQPYGGGGSHEMHALLTKGSILQALNFLRMHRGVHPPHETVLPRALRMLGVSG